MAYFQYLNCFTKTETKLNRVQIGVIRCAECRWRSLKFGTLPAVIASKHPEPSYPGQDCSVWSSFRVRKTRLQITLSWRSIGAREERKVLRGSLHGRHETQSGEHFPPSVVFAASTAAVYLLVSTNSQELKHVWWPAVPGILDLHPDTRPWSLW